MKTFTFGFSAESVPITGYRWVKDGPEVLVLGGVHGDEPEGVWAATGLLHRLMDYFPYLLNLTIVPVFNVDGVMKDRRVNGNGVDLNRNLPTKDWDPKAAKPRYNPGKGPCSEPENQALVKYIQDYQPKWIISLHSWEPMLNVNGDCKKLADFLHQRTGYRIDDYIGYPTPGSLGTYSGMERKIPTLTYEIQRDLDAPTVLNQHVPALFDALELLQ